MSNYFVALDIGASKIVCLRGRQEESGVIRIDTITTHMSEGIERGGVIDEKIFIEDLSSVVYESEKKLSHEISDITINISTPLIRNKKIRVFKKFYGKQITEKDLEDTLLKAKNKIEADGNKIIKIGFLGHFVEGMGEVKDPEYMFIRGITSTVSAVYIPEKYIIDLNNLLLRSHVKAKRFVLSSEAAAYSCLRDEEMQGRTILLDIGATNTDYIVYEQGNVAECGVIPLGGKNITKDISMYFNISFEKAEEIKKQHSSICSNTNGQYINTKSIFGKNKIIDKKLLKEIIVARLEEMMSIVFKRIGTEKQKYDFVLTGGGSNIQDLEMFLNKRYGILSRVAYPEDMGDLIIQNDHSHDFSTRSLTTACGLIKFVIKQGAHKEVLSQGVLKKIFRWIKESF